MLNSRQLRKMIDFDESVYFDPANADYKGSRVMGVFLASEVQRKLMVLLVHSLIVNRLVLSEGYTAESVKLTVYDRDYKSYFDSDVCFFKYAKIMGEQIDCIMNGYGWNILESDEFFIEEDDMSNYIDDEDGDSVRRIICDSLEQSGFSNEMVEVLLNETNLKIAIEGYYDSSFRVRVYTNNRLSNYLLSKEADKNMAWNKHIISMLGMINHENAVGVETFWLRGKMYFLELQTSYFDADTGLYKEGGAHNVDFCCIADLAETNEVLTRYGY